YFGLQEYGYSIGATDIPDRVLRYARTMSFVVLAASQLFYSLSMRNPTKLVFKIGIFSNMFLIGSIVIGIILQLVVISIPFLANSFGVQFLSVRDWGMVLLFSLIPLIVNEVLKLFNRTPAKDKINHLAGPHMFL
ncbi:MAG TPA: cation-translocating P-type ATPase C-terminal domain-containing protein, partial [Mobilitalea sp.]|nr:cation-translocating P-type ATPase C-terminal domain-containing protein [Mobilitalea sp.]